MFEIVLLLAGAIIVDAVIGDPHYPLHPVRLIGKLAGLLERVFRHMGLTGYAGGAVFWILVISIVLGVYLAIRICAGMVHEFLVPTWDVFVLYSSFALRDLWDHARPVWTHLEDGDLDNARSSVQKIVGRNTNILSPHGVARAAIESISESFVDGFAAPLFWFAAGALLAEHLQLCHEAWAIAAVISYRTINTLDSIVGYRNKRFKRFGWTSAKADDIVNWLPARLSILPLIPSALLCRLSLQGALKTWLRDKNKLQSPNSGQTESFTAGALNLRLGGPVTYSHGTIAQPWLGITNAKTKANAQHIRSCTHLIICASYLYTLTIGVLLLFL